VKVKRGVQSMGSHTQHDTVQHETVQRNNRIDRYRISLLGVTLAAIAALLLAACSSSTPKAVPSSSTKSTAARIPLTLAYPGNSASLPVYVALAKGYFKQEGLDVTSKVITNITEIVPLLGKGVDIGFGTEPILLQAASHGLPIIEIANNELVPPSHKEYMLVGAKGITSVSQLAGKTIGAATVAGNINAAALYTLYKDGVNIKSIHVIQVDLPNALATLQSGQVAATEEAEPFTALALSHGFKALADVCTGVGNPCSMSLWIATKSWATSHGAEIADYTRALGLADKYIAANPNGALKFLAAATNIPYSTVVNTPVSDFVTQPSLSNLGRWEKILKVVDGVDITIPPAKLELGG